VQSEGWKNGDSFGMGVVPGQNWRNFYFRGALTPHRFTGLKQGFAAMLKCLLKWGFA
jgi:hypothetical protein